MIKDKILVVAADHNEKDMQLAINSALSNAFDKSRIVFSICSSNRKNNLEADGIENIKIQYHSAIGVTLPKLIGTIYNDDSHEYTLIIDAHTVFKKNWDETLINYYKKINISFDKFLISPSVPAWVDYSHLEDLLRNNSITNLEMMIALEESPQNDNFFRVTGHARIVDWEQHINGYKESQSISGNCMFGKKEIFEEFIMDPLVVWGGDQECLALRLSTRGYKFFTIRDVFCLTREKPIDYYKSEPEDWRNFQNNLVWKAIFKRSNNRMRDIFTGKILGYWGAPDKESLIKYTENSQLNFNKISLS